MSVNGRLKGQVSWLSYDTGSGRPEDDFGGLTISSSERERALAALFVMVLRTSVQKKEEREAEARNQNPCLRWPLPPPSPTLAQWLDGLTVPTIHSSCAEKQPAHLLIVSDSQTSQTGKTRPKFSSDWSPSGQMSFWAPLCFGVQVDMCHTTELGQQRS